MMDTFIQKRTMFVTEPEESREDTERSLYGEPQHEENVENGWETDYYGGPNVEETPEPTEFVPHVEHRGSFDEDGNATSRRPESGKRSRARTIDRIAP